MYLLFVTGAFDLKKKLTFRERATVLTANRIMGALVSQHSRLQIHWYSAGVAAAR